jgi:hypothetical protein
MLSKVGSPQYLFNKIVGFVAKHAGHTFHMGVTLPRQETQSNKCSKSTMFLLQYPYQLHLRMAPRALLSIIVIANNQSLYKPDPLKCLMMQDHLLDPFLFGNKNNLVNGDNPWGKYISSNPNNEKEVLASYWYSKTYDEYITDPDTQVLLYLEAYVDKTAKNVGLTSYAGEPFLLSALHLKKSLREHSSAWFVQAYLPDLESVHPQRRSHTLTDTLPGTCPIAIATR